MSLNNPPSRILTSREAAAVAKERQNLVNMRDNFGEICENILKIFEVLERIDTDSFFQNIESELKKYSQYLEAIKDEEINPKESEKLLQDYLVLCLLSRSFEAVLSKSNKQKEVHTHGRARVDIIFELFKLIRGTDKNSVNLILRDTHIANLLIYWLSYTAQNTLEVSIREKTRAMITNLFSPQFDVQNIVSADFISSPVVIKSEEGEANQSRTIVRYSARQMQLLSQLNDRTGQLLNDKTKEELKEQHVQLRAIFMEYITELLKLFNDVPRVDLIDILAAHIEVCRMVAVKDNLEFTSKELITCFREKLAFFQQTREFSSVSDERNTSTPSSVMCTLRIRRVLATLTSYLQS